MRKRILHPVHNTAAADDFKWLDIDSLADVEVTSEDPAHPIESALLPHRTSGWRAGGPGQQTIRLLFTSPQQLRRIRVSFVESGTRTCCCTGALVHASRPSTATR